MDEGGGDEQRRADERRREGFVRGAMDEGRGGDEQRRPVEWRADQRRRKELERAMVGRGTGELRRRTGRAAGLCEVELCVLCGGLVAEACEWRRLEIKLGFGHAGVCQILPRCAFW
jgi:hypothetical protein